VWVARAVSEDVRFAQLPNQRCVTRQKRVVKPGLMRLLAVRRSHPPSCVHLDAAGTRRPDGDAFGTDLLTCGNNKRYSPVMATETEGLIRELLELTACPWSDLTVFDDSPECPTGMLKEMLDFWEEIAELHGFALYTEVDAEIDRAGEDGANDMYELTNQRDETVNVIAGARDKYRKLTRRFFEMRVADERVRKKHYTSKNDERNAIVSRTRGGNKKDGSLFYPEVTPEMLLRVIWDLLEVRWRDLLNTTHVRLWVDVMERIGASAGTETKLVCFDLEFSTPLAHAFPVLKADKTTPDDADPWLYCDVLQGMVSPTY
jgi:hypothetical protein